MSMDELLLHAQNGLQEFRENPITYTKDALIDTIKDFGDLGMMALAAYAIKDYDGKVLGNARAPIILTTLAIAAIPNFKSRHRCFRNMYATLAAICASYLDLSQPLSSADNFSAGITTTAFLIGAYTSEKSRNNALLETPSSRPITSPVYPIEQ